MKRKKRRTLNKIQRKIRNKYIMVQEKKNKMRTILYKRKFPALNHPMRAEMVLSLLLWFRPVNRQSRRPEQGQTDRKPTNEGKHLPTPICVAQITELDMVPKHPASASLFPDVIRTLTVKLYLRPFHGQYFLWAKIERNLIDQLFLLFWPLIFCSANYIVDSVPAITLLKIDRTENMASSLTV